jgi:hypothetical protein
MAGFMDGPAADREAGQRLFIRQKMSAVWVLGILRLVVGEILYSTSWRWPDYNSP